MIKLFDLKKQESKAGAGAAKKKTSAAMLRAQKDHNELSLPRCCKLAFDDANDLLNFRLTIKPDEGMYEGGNFTFSFVINHNYPHDAPKVHCDTKVYHPNIDLEGNVCLNILREDWKPVLNLQTVITGLLFLFLEPNPSDPLNDDAAQDMEANKAGFARNVAKAMRGGSVGGVQFERCI